MLNRFAVTNSWADGSTEKAQNYWGLEGGGCLTGLLWPTLGQMVLLRGHKITEDWKEVGA